MPTEFAKLVAEYRERAKKLRLAAETALHIETRRQLLVIADDYEDLAKTVDLLDRWRRGN